MTPHPDTTRRRRVTVGDIAQLARVRPSAVSNWRGRHNDFPLPIEATSGGDLFDLDNVLQWLSTHGKSYQSSPTTFEEALWRVRDTLHSSGLRLEESTLLTMQLLYFRYCAERPALREQRTLSALWPKLLKERTDARAIWEAAVSKLSKTAPLLSHALEPLPRIPDQDIAQTVSIVATISPKEIDWGQAATLLLRHYENAQGVRGAPSLTPDSLTDLMLRLLEPIAGTIYDPAAGLAMILVNAWRRRVDDEVLLVAQEINEYNWRLGFLHLALNEASFRMETGDTLHYDQFRSLRADRIAADPPFGQKINIRDETPDERWAFGVPRSTSEWLWAQHLIFHLNERGVGVMTITPAALSRSGTEETIRLGIVEAGLLEAVIELPPGLLTGSAIPIALLIFAKNRTTYSGRVLFLDARQLGNARRGKPHELTSDDITRIQSTVAAWREGTFDEQPLFAASATVDQILINRGDLSATRYVRYSRRATEVDRAAIDERLSLLTPRIADGQTRLQTAANEIRLGRDAFVPELLSDWPFVRLRDLLLIEPQAGTRQDPDGEGTAMPYIQTSVVSGGSPRLQAVPQDITHGRVRGRVVKSGDLLLVSRGIDERRGGCAIVAFEEPAAYAESLIRLSPDPSRVDPDYLRSYLTSRQGRMALAAATTGSVIANLRPQALSEIEIPLPDLVTQHQIGTAINRIEDGVSVLGNMLEVSREMLDTVREGIAAGLYRAHTRAQLLSTDFTRKTTEF